MDNTKNNNAILSVVTQTADDLKFGERKTTNDKMNNFSRSAFKNFFFKIS